MGKIVKYCAACDESFAEKFGFCPNCGQAMTAFEMSPVAKDAPAPIEPTKPATIVPVAPVAVAPPVLRETEPLLEVAPTAQTIPVVAAPEPIISETIATEKVLPVTEKISPAEKPALPTKTFAAAAGANGSGNFNRNAVSNVQASAPRTVQPREAFSVTVIEEKNGKQRNLLLLASMALILTLALGGTVYSLFNKDMGIGAIDDGGLFAAIVVEEVPMEVEEQPKPKEKEAGGGGGGGGRDEPEEASKGRLVSQAENPITPPNARVPQLTNPELKIIQETKGTIKREITEERAGLPGSDNLNPSNGRGNGGGIGSGSGTGIGSGNGTGEGSGNGSGSGNGNGNGNGDGTGNGTGAGRTPPPPPVARPVEVVTIPFRIISKPRATYTDAARQNQVTGVVRLKVTFLPSGAIGSIAPVSGLPYGLTEQAISAARQIKFEPQKKNGSAVAVTKTIEYSFSIY